MSTWDKVDAQDLYPQTRHKHSIMGVSTKDTEHKLTITVANDALKYQRTKPSEKNIKSEKMAFAHCHFKHF